MSEKYFIFLVVGVLLLSSLIALAGILAVLPRAMDDFLLTNEDYCDIVVVSLKVKEESIYSKWNSKECSIDDAILNDVDIAVDEKVQVTRIQRQQERQQYSTKFQRMTNFVLWKIALHLWQQSTEDYDITDTSPKDYLPSLHAPNHHDGLVHTIDNECVQRTKYLHPLCDGYRKLRSRIQFEKLSYPWTWYFTSFIRMKNLTLHSLKRNVEFVSHQNYNQGMIGWSILPTREVVTPATIKNYMETPDPSLYSQSNLPPAMEIETMDISLQSTWVHPVISAQVHGIVINFVIQSGEFLLPLHRSHHHHHHHGKSFNHTAFLIGDMTLQEVVQVLPKPPEVEGLFPRIGLVNITNVTLCVYENKDVANDGPSSLKVLMKIRVPDKFFFPITTMTIAHRNTGIDRKHFQKKVELSLSEAFRRHLLNEAQSAIRNSWISAHKAQEQLQQLVIHTQELYMDRWLNMGGNAWRQVIEHGAGPILKAVDDWVTDLREIVTDPVPPVMVVLSHYWNRTMEGINRHGIAIDKQVWGQLNDMVTNVNEFHREKRLSKHLTDLMEAFDGFITKTGQDMDTLIQSCELEVKDLWLSWHRQFLPEL